MSHTLHGLTSAGPRWENNDFVWHFFTGNGRSLLLSQIDHLYEIANYWAYGLSIFQNWNVQIVEEARKRGQGIHAWILIDRTILGRLNTPTAIRL